MNKQCFKDWNGKYVEGYWYSIGRKWFTFKCDGSTIKKILKNAIDLNILNRDKWGYLNYLQDKISYLNFKLRKDK